MPETISGLPLDSLIVHAVVVLLPLSAVGAVLMAVWPKFSRRFGGAVVLIVLGAAAASWFVRASGQQLDEVLEAGQRHMDLGSQMPFLATLFATATLTLWLYDRRLSDDSTGPQWLRVLAVVVAVLAIVTPYFVILTGDSGARAVWAEHWLPATVMSTGRSSEYRSPPSGTSSPRSPDSSADE